MTSYPNMRAAAILRVSSAKQTEGVSLDVQRHRIESYAKSNSLELDQRHIHELAESGKRSEDRKKYKEAMDEIIAKGIHHLLFLVSDREARNFTDSERNEELIRAGALTVHYVQDGKVLSKYSPDADFLMKDFQTLQAKHFVRTLSTKVNDAMNTKAEMGWYPSNHPPLGYVTHYPEGRRKNCIIIQDPNPKAIAHVRREFELRAQGLSFDAIRRQIIEDGLIPAEKIVAYHASAIEKRIKNPFYRGSFIWKGQTYKGLHPLIIDKEILDAIDGNGHKRGTSWGAQPTERGIFGRGWLKCADPACGCHVVFDPKRKTNKKAGTSKEYHFYHCSNGKKVHTSLKGMNVTEDALYQQFGAVVSDVTIDEHFAKQIADALNENKKAAMKKIEAEASAHQQALKQLDREEDEAYDDLKCGLLNDESYKRRVERVRERRDHFNTLLKNANKSVTEAALENAQSVLELANQAKSLWLTLSPPERRGLLDTVLSNPRLNGPTVEYDLKKPFAVILKMKRSCPT